MKEQITYQIIADYFIALSNETQSLITNLKLQKLTYYAQAWHLAIFDQVLFEDDFEAWVHGPVLPALYYQYKGFAWKPIQREDLGEGSFGQIEAKMDIHIQDFLKQITEEYFGLNAFELERLTHNEEPWKNARRGIPEDQPSSEIISKDMMKSYYSLYIDHAEAPKAKV